MGERWWNLETTLILAFDTRDEAWTAFSDDLIDGLTDVCHRLLGRDRGVVMRFRVEEIEDGEPITSEP